MNLDEFSSAFKESYPDASDQDVKDAFNLGDLDSNNKLSFDEFDILNQLVELGAKPKATS